MQTTDNNVTRFSLIAAFGGFVFGLDAANISGAVRFVSAQFELSSMEQGLVVSCALLGVIVALFFTGTLVERYGRKKVLLGIAFMYSLSSFLSATALNFPMLVLGRFIGGVAFASITVSAMYIGEIAPADKRGRFVSINQLLITLGSLIAFVINYFLVKAMDPLAWLHEQNIWRLMLGAELIANAIWVALLLKIPESPRWLIKKSREEEAHNALKTIVAEKEINHFVAEVKDSLNEDDKHTTLEQLKNLFSKRMSFIILIAVVYAIVQGGTGTNAVLFYAPTVFEQIGMSVEDTFMQTIILGVVQVVFTLVAITTVEKYGRRYLTLAGTALIIVAHASTWHGFNTASYELNESAIVKIQSQDVDTSKLEPLIGNSYGSDVALKADLAKVYDKSELPLVSGPIIDSTININAAFVLFGIFAFLAAFNMSIGPIMWVIFSEIFPNNVRSVALPFAALVQTISSFTIQQFFPWQLENLGAANTFLYYGFVAFIGLIAMAFILPETKSKSIEMIEKDLVRA